MKNIAILILIFCLAISAKAQETKSTDYRQFWGKTNEYFEKFLLSNSKWHKNKTESIGGNSIATSYYATSEPGEPTVMMKFCFDNEKGLFAIVTSYYLGGMPVGSDFRVPNIQGVPAGNNMWQDKANNVKMRLENTDNGVIQYIDPF